MRVKPFSLSRGSFGLVMKPLRRIFKAPIKLAACGVLASMTLSTAAHADTERALDACIQEFTSTQLAGYAGKITIRKDTSEAPTSLPLVSKSTQRITVDAVHRASGSRLASVTCHVDSTGAVIAMKAAYVSPKLASIKAAKVAKN